MTLAHAGFLQGRLSAVLSLPPWVSHCGPEEGLFGRRDSGVLWVCRGRFLFRVFRSFLLELSIA